MSTRHFIKMTIQYFYVRQVCQVLNCQFESSNSKITFLGLSNAQNQTVAESLKIPNPHNTLISLFVNRFAGRTLLRKYFILSNFGSSLFLDSYGLSTSSFSTILSFLRHIFVHQK